VQADWDRRDENNQVEKTEGNDENNEEAQDVAQLKTELNEEDLIKRVFELVESITSTSWDFLRRGLFDNHKVVVISILCFRIKVKKNELPVDQYQQLILGKSEATTAPPEPLKFIQETNWQMIKGLEGL